jgi:CubicO group peptidase (beta-lactamase class C family)
MRAKRWMIGWVLLISSFAPARAAEPASAVRETLSREFPPSEDQGGWPSLLPKEGSPDAERKAQIRARTGVDWDKLEDAWNYNAAAGGATGMVVIRKGTIVGEWYQKGDRTTDFNIYSSSKSYTSTAYGLILADFGAGTLPGGKTLKLDTKVCNSEWIPESLPLSDPRKAGITVRNLLNMASGIGPDMVPVDKRPFEWSLGHVEGSPVATLKGDPGTFFSYSNANVAHLVLLFQHAQETDLYPFLKERLFDPIGIKHLRWDKIGGNGTIGPYNQGYSGIHTTPREHARFCYLALHRGEWAGKRIVPESYYDFAWKGISVKPDYGAQWWVYPHIADAPRDLVMTLGRNHNDGFVTPSLDLVFVRLGDGEKFPKDFEPTLVGKVLAAVDK